jgi:predicted ATP-dependent endonuclease of OLD family
MIVEGQAEYLIVHALARQLGYDLDEHGVSVIDAVNNGHPATFAVLARALGIPWLAVLDGDDGRGAIPQISSTLAHRRIPGYQQGAVPAYQGVRRE